MDEFEVMVAIILAVLVMVCCFAVIGIAMTFFRFMG
jgi:hypothetical protein